MSFSFGTNKLTNNNFEQQQQQHENWSKHFHCSTSFDEFIEILEDLLLYPDEMCKLSLEMFNSVTGKNVQ